MAKRFKWTVEFSVDASWVEDGFNLTKERAHQMITNTLTHASNSEVDARIIKRPTDKSLAKIQGYKTVAAFRKDNK